MIFLHKHFCLLIFFFVLSLLKKIHKFDKFNYEITFYIIRLYVGVGGEFIPYIHALVHDGLKKKFYEDRMCATTYVRP